MTTATAHKTERSNRILTFLLGSTSYAIDIYYQFSVEGSQNKQLKDD